MLGTPSAESIGRLKRCFLHYTHYDTCAQPVTKLEFEFERRRITKENVRELIDKESLEYHPQILKEYLDGSETTNFMYPRYLADLLYRYTLVYSSMICIVHSAVRWNISRNSLLASRNTTRMVLLILPLRGRSTNHYLGLAFCTMIAIMMWKSLIDCLGVASERQHGGDRKAQMPIRSPQTIQGLTLSLLIQLLCRTSVVSDLVVMKQ
ncbi:hypothetical protein Bca101_026156 [Brassica carinata]